MGSFDGGVGVVEEVGSGPTRSTEALDGDSRPGQSQTGDASQFEEVVSGEKRTLGGCSRPGR